jgi:hypothetical protein
MSDRELMLARALALLREATELAARERWIAAAAIALAGSTLLEELPHAIASEERERRAERLRARD